MQLLSVWCNESIQDIRAALGPFVPSPSTAAPQFGYLRATYYDEHGANKIKLMKGELPWRTGHVQDFPVTVTLNPKPLNPLTLNPKPCQREEEANTEGMDHMEGTLSSVNFPQYEVLYDKWKKNNLSDAEVVTIGGKNLLDLMQAQYILDIETVEWEQEEHRENEDDKKGEKGEKRKLEEAGLT